MPVLRSREFRMSRSELYAIASEAEFEKWLKVMVQELTTFYSEVPADIAQGLDYSTDSLIRLEHWLLKNYRSIDQLCQDPQTLDRAARYVGETLRRAVGGRWLVELRDDDAYFGYP